jgi:glycosyltransferase involved in cell wall biosynthesis
MHQQPLISCLCITRNKPSLLKRAINCFLSQTYPNKELIIIYEEGDLNSKDVINSYSCGQISGYEISIHPKLSLGQLRNISIQRCKGEYFCQWDDDDWYHDQRLELQLYSIQSNFKPVCILTNWLMYDMVEDKSYLSFTRTWEGSVLCRKDLVSDTIKYENASKGEDSTFIKSLLLTNHIFPLIMPSLYIYVYHGNNAWNRAHFIDNFQKSKSLSKSLSIHLKKILSNEYNNREASELLMSREVLEEFDYLHSLKKQAF